MVLQINQSGSIYRVWGDSMGGGGGLDSGVFTGGKVYGRGDMGWWCTLARGV